MEALILVGLEGREDPALSRGPGVGVQSEWEGVERGVPGNPRSSERFAGPWNKPVANCRS